MNREKIITEISHLLETILFLTSNEKKSLKEKMSTLDEKGLTHIKKELLNDIENQRKIITKFATAHPQFSEDLSRFLASATLLATSQHTTAKIKN